MDFDKMMIELFEGMGITNLDRVVTVRDEAEDEPEVEAKKLELENVQ